MLRFSHNSSKRTSERNAIITFARRLRWGSDELIIAPRSWKVKGPKCDSARIKSWNKGCPPTLLRIHDGLKGGGRYTLLWTSSAYGLLKKRRTGPKGVPRIQR